MPEIFCQASMGWVAEKAAYHFFLSPALIFPRHSPLAASHLFYRLFYIPYILRETFFHAFRNIP